MRILRDILMNLSRTFMVACATVTSLSAFALPPDQVYVKASPSVVMVFVGEDAKRISGQGSGVIVGTERVITNCHVVLGKDGVPFKYLVVKRGNQTLTAIFSVGNKDYDSCLLLVKGLVASTATIANSAGLRVGQRVYAIGAPSGLDLTLTDGLISSLRTIGRSRVIQTTAAISPGSSGGGLFDENGDLIGITSFVIDNAGGLNFAYMAEPILNLIALSEKVSETSAKSRYEPLPTSAREVLFGSLKGGRTPKSSFRNPEEETKWLERMSSKLVLQIPNQENRLEFLKAAHYEATLAGLDPQLVLALVDTVSKFKKYAVSSSGARGYMQVNPKWVELLGGNNDNIFHLRMNLRYGCTILKHYLDDERGDLLGALIRYRYSMNGDIAATVKGAANEKRFPDQVRKAWETTWEYPYDIANP